MANVRPTVDSRYYSGQGICLLGDRDENGKPTGMTTIGNVPELTLNIERTVEEHKESWSGQRGVDVTIGTETSVTLAITFESFDPDLLAIGLLGNSETRTAGTSVVDDAVTIYHDKWTYLDHVSISNLSITAGGAGAVEGDDYVVNEAGGAIMGLSTGANDIGDDVVIEVTYDHVAQYDLQALTKSAPEKYFIFDGLNTRDGKSVRLEIFRLQTEPFTGIGFINDGIAQGSVSANALSDSNRTASETTSTFFREIIAQ